MLIKAKGILNFSPLDVTKKHLAQSEWKTVAMIEIDGKIDQYYKWFIETRFMIKLNKNLRGTHVTFISEMLDRELYKKVAEKYNGLEVEFYYSVEPFTNGKHWWLRVFCFDIEPIREELNLDKYPYFGLHLTLGRLPVNQLDKGQYIKGVCDFHQLLLSGPRKKFDEYLIIE
jgi:hypothetical protein